jgi:serine/threonine protein kinase
LRPELSSRRFVKLPNLREKACFHERLGRGGYGSVYRITLGGLACALKKIDIGRLSEKQRHYALQEVQVMETLQHENIIKYLGHELIEEKNELHILMELFPLSLGQLIERRRKLSQKFSASDIKHFAVEILTGIDYLHNQQIIHRFVSRMNVTYRTFRDMKSDNILVDMDENGKVNKVKITDFGVCKKMNDRNTEDHTRVGTELYMSPEVHTSAQYTTKADSKY